MPYLMPSRTPLTPEQVEQGFDYLLALQTGGGTCAAGRVEATPELAFVLLRLAEDIIWPVTAVDGEATDPCADSFALDEVGWVLLSALRDWARTPPPRRCWASPQHRPVHGERHPGPRPPGPAARRAHRRKGRAAPAGERPTLNGAGHRPAPFTAGGAAQRRWSPPWYRRSPWWSRW